MPFALGFMLGDLSGSHFRRSASKLSTPNPRTKWSRLGLPWGTRG